jgi:23S rRNA (adenine2030-N6)-methyltransferase
MNYRHLYHAGNFADVHKHVVLVALLDYLLLKPKPIFYLDTHAGRGMYDLHSEEATKGGEWRAGIGALLQATPKHALLTRYLDCLKGIVNDGWPAMRTYPGSPVIARALLRAADRAVFVEKNAREAEDLKAVLQRKRDLSVLCEDGYIALKAHTPPKENRGLILIDPPYEDSNEFDVVTQSLISAWRRWPSGVYALWYPLTASNAPQQMQQVIRHSGIRKVLIAEFAVRPIDSPLGLNGSGLLIVNPPWRLDEQLREAQTELLTALAPSGTGSARVEWLVRE